MIILGLDPGIADTGYGIIESAKNEYKVIVYGSIKTSKQKDLAERLGQLSQNIKKIIRKYKPEVAAVEELFFAKNVKTAITVAHARGVLLQTAYGAGCRVREFTPLQVKLALTGYGRAEKLQMQKMVKAILGLAAIPKPDDAADALAVAICCGQTRPLAASS